MRITRPPNLVRLATLTQDNLATGEAEKAWRILTRNSSAGVKVAMQAELQGIDLTKPSRR